MTHFNDTQYEALAPYKPYFLTAVNEKWCRNPGRHALEKMAEIWRAVAKQPGFHMNFNCSTCVVNIVRDLGTLWLKDEAAREAEKAEKAQAEPEKAPEAPKPHKVATTAKKTATAKKKTVKTEKE